MTDDLEARLRSALAARADRLTLGDLRPSAPPTLRPARRAFTIAVRALVIATSLALVAFVLIPDRTPVVEPGAPAPSSSPDCISRTATATANPAALPTCPYTGP